MNLNLVSNNEVFKWIQKASLHSSVKYVVGLEIHYILLHQIVRLNDIWKQSILLLTDKLTCIINSGKISGLNNRAIHIKDVGDITYRKSSRIYRDPSLPYEANTIDGLE